MLLAFMLLSMVGFAQNGYKVGDIAGDFKLKNINNKMVSLADFKDAKGFIIIFTCNHCPYSKIYEDRIVALDKKYAKKGYPVIAINPNDPKVEAEDSFDKMKERAKEKHFSFPYLVDEGQLITKAYGASRTPHVFVLQKSKEGNKIAYIGAVDNDTENTNPSKINYTQNAVDALLTGKKPDPEFTKAIGCSIKWKKTS